MKKPKGQIYFRIREIVSFFPYLALTGILVYLVLTRVNLISPFQYLTALILSSFWSFYLYSLRNGKILKKNNRKEVYISTIYFLIFTIILFYRLITPLPIVFASTPTPTPPSVSDSPDPQAGGQSITFSCSACSSGGTNEYMKLLICKSVSGECVMRSQWSYRKPITISSSSAQTDYQVKITDNTNTLISAGKMRSDCADIRFTDSDGGTLLNYWLESGCNSASTVIWIKVPSIPSGGKTIYMYYGNPQATSISNGDRTFDFFDHFEGTSLNTTKWNSYTSGGATITVSNSVVKLSGVQNVGAQARITSKTNYLYYAFGAMLYTDWLGTGTNSYGAARRWGWSNQTNSDVYAKVDADEKGHNLHTRQVTGGSEDTRYINDDSKTYKIWYVTWKSGESKVFVNGTLMNTSTSYIPTAAIPIYMQADTWATSNNKPANLWVDWVFARKYSAGDLPTSVGAEQTNTASDYVWSQSSLVQSNPSSSYSCASCGYAANTYYGVSFNINQTIWTSFTSALSFTCKKENLCACSAGECYNECKNDPDNVGAWCCNSNQCSHDASCYTLVELASAGSSSCLEGENIAHNTQGTTNYRYADYDGQLYYCGTSNADKSGYSQVTNFIPGDKVGLCQCLLDGTWNCGGVIKIRGGRIGIVGSFLSILNNLMEKLT
jgi:hypothetical protein